MVKYGKHGEIEYVTAGIIKQGHLKPVRKNTDSHVSVVGCGLTRDEMNRIMSIVS